MAEPQSPFDEPDEAELHPGDAPQVGRKPLERKWSFIWLGIVLFVLVWVREFTGLSPYGTIATAILILVAWAVVHASLFTTLPQASLRFPEHTRSRRTTGLAELEPPAVPPSHARLKPWRGRLVWLAAVVGLLIVIAIPLVVLFPAATLRFRWFVTFLFFQLVGWLFR